MPAAQVPHYDQSVVGRDLLIVPTLTDDQRAAAWRLLARHDANDLADMLGLTEKATAS